MTLSRYKRLCKVLILPLLGLGVVAYFALWPYPRSASYFCELRDTEQCTNAGEYGSHVYDFISKQHPNYAEVYVGKSRPLESYYTIRISPRYIANAEINYAKAYAGNSLASSELVGSLQGMRATLNFGGFDEYPSFVTKDYAVLYCNQLSLEKESSVYSTHCFGPGWGGFIKFSPSVENSDSLMMGNMKEAVFDKSSDTNRFNVIYFLFAVPIFVYVFLLLSFLWWLTSKAIRYVKSG